MSPEIGTGGLIDRLGAEDVKHTVVENLAGSSIPQPPVNNNNGLKL